MLEPKTFLLKKALSRLDFETITSKKHCKIIVWIYFDSKIIYKSQNIQRVIDYIVEKSKMSFMFLIIVAKQILY